jgi:transposase
MHFMNRAAGYPSNPSRGKAARTGTSADRYRKGQAQQEYLYQFQALRTTSLSYRDALNAVSHFAFEHGKTSSNITLHKGCIAKPWYDKARKTFYLLVSLEISMPEPTSEQLSEVVGVDVGIRYLAVTSTKTGTPLQVCRVAVESRGNTSLRSLTGGR